ncbi:MAG: hypothetical protein ABEJ80_07935 [Halarchaeum sp.]
MSAPSLSDEGVHGALVVVALVGLAVVVALTAMFAGSALRMVALSAVYVGGVCAFWLGYWALSRGEATRRERLLDR